jgi:hypothetical protein
MYPLQIQDEVQTYGITFTLDGDTLRFKAQKPVPRPVLERIKVHKPEIIAYLRNPPQREPDPNALLRQKNSIIWAQGIMTGRASVFIETPNDPHDERRISTVCRTPEALAFYRARAEAWGKWITVRDGTEEIFNNNSEEPTPANVIVYKPGGPQRASDLPLPQSKVR